MLIKISNVFVFLFYSLGFFLHSRFILATEEANLPPLPAPTAATGPSIETAIAIGGTISATGTVQRDDSPPRGPRTLLLRRSEYGFGFTLRHFIVYPPEACCILPGHERTNIDEPMDTIFVKQVRPNSPAAEAGLRTGDRVVSVDGKPTRGEQYAKVVQRIQQAGPWLRLLVVSKEDDILQRYFGETAHNPETNQRPRLRSPERSCRRQRRSASMIPGLSPRTRQSWVCSASSSMPLPYQDHDPSLIDQGLSGWDPEIRPNEFSKETEQVRGNNSKMQPQMARNVMYRSKPTQEAAIASRYEPVDDKTRLRNQQQQQQQQPVKGVSSSTSAQPYDKPYEVYDRTRSESIYSRTNSDQIYDRIKDPIYERVRLEEPMRTSMEEHHHQQQQSPQRQQQQHQQYYQSQHSSLSRFPLSRAEPQVPTFRLAARRTNSRRASEGSTSNWTINNLDTASYASADALRSCEPGSRFSIDSRRDSSPARVNDPSSYDVMLRNGTNPAKNENRNGNLYGYKTNNGSTGAGSDSTINTSIDDSVIMTRLRKSFEQKEEFLRRPSHPIGWFLPEKEDRPESPIRSNASSSTSVIPREFYARPQKLQKQIWPPSDLKPDQQFSRVVQDQNRVFAGKLPADKSSLSQSVQQAKNKNGTSSAEAEYFASRSDQIEESPNTMHSFDHAHRQPMVASSAVYENRSDLKEQGDRDKHRSTGKSNNFVGTLSRIQENIANVGSFLSYAGDRQAIDARNGASSLPSSPGPDKKVANDKFPTLPQGLQIVSKRAKQFESGRLLSDDDEPTGDRTSLYKSELSRLSNKRSVPNVAVRKREFESKAEAQEPRRALVASTRETKSLDNGNGLKGNRVIPVGSRHIHCAPPATYSAQQDTLSSRIVYNEVGPSRIRSNSAESWESTSNSVDLMNRHQWPQREDETGRKRDANETEENRGYVDASDDGNEKIIDTEHDSDVHRNGGVVFRRQKNTQISDEDRATRRVSYLKATWGERIHVDSDLELSDSEPIIHSCRSVHKRWRLPPLLRNDIASLRRIFEEVTQSTSLNRHINRGNPTYPGREAPANVTKSIEQVEREGPLHVKFTVIDGKRSSDRSWKQVWGVLRGPILFFYKDRQNQSPSLSNDGENVVQSVDVRCSLVDIAEDYTKRKHVLRLANPHSTEILLQTEDAASMALWLRALHDHAAAEKPSEIAQNSTLKQQAVPQTPGPTSNSTSSQVIANTGAVMSGGQRLSPLPGHKGIKKLTSFRNRSPTGQSPINKSRKPSQTIESLVSPKTKTWKGRVAKQLRRMHGQTGSPSSPTTQLPPEGATFKVPLELCRPSSFSEYVPLIVEMCTSIVEARGLEVIGIYRVPGNTAAISHLTESVNKGFENINLQDPRWSDVNVISSLLKSFFRQLPDSLLTAELYPMFIDADKVEDPQRRMTTIRKLLRDLPDHHFETLKYLMFHLKRIVEHSEVNKMEAKNLAIVFGPTLVRASGSRDNMVTMVTDMSHQCRIVESLLNNVDWFFSDDDLDDLSRLSVNLSLPADTSEIEAATSSNNHSLLLNNIHKMEGVREMASAKDIVSSIISAANRKIQRRRKCQDETDSEVQHQVDKTRTKQESLPNRQSMALSERQCSVSQIVLMHENKSQSNRSPPLDGSSGNDHVSTTDGSRDVLDSHGDVGPDEKSKKYLNHPASHRSAVSSASESSRLSSETGLSCFDASSTLSSASNDTKQSNDEITIRTYAGLSATTQERIRKFEQETKAMLQRDQNRQRREAEKREEERQRIELEWQLAKREMEDDDLLDNIVDTTVTTPAYHLAAASRLSNLTGFRSAGSRIPPLSIAVQQQPTSAIRRVSQLAELDESSTILSPENVSNTIIKKLKTGTEMLEPSTLPPIRYGSLDSLHETHDVSQTSLSPTSQQRKPISSDVSDDAGSCFLQWTQKILTINKKLSRQTANPGFWWYISSHLHGAGSPAGSATKTPGPSPVPMPIPMSMPISMPMSMPMPMPMSMPGRVQVPGSGSVSVSDATATGNDRGSPSSGLPASERVEPIEQSPPRGVSSSSGAGLSSKTLNRFLRGSDLLTSLTTTFDRKWRSLVNSSNPTIRGSETENASLSDEDVTVTRDSQNLRTSREESREGEDEDGRKTTASKSADSSCPVDNYRDPSLHKMSTEKHQHVRQKNDAPEKDTDSSVVENSGSVEPVGAAVDIPDNDRSAIARRRIESKQEQLRSSKDTVDEQSSEIQESNCRTEKEATASAQGEKGADSNYSNKLKKFESLTSSEVKSRLKRSESLNKRSENTSSKLKRSESLNKHSVERLSSPTNGKLKRSESLNKHSERSDSPNSKLKRSESLTKTEKTECNISKRRQSVRKDSATKLKRKNGMPERSIKRRHTVGGTKDFDKVHWLDNKLQVETERVVRNECRPKKSQLRTSSPDLSTGRIGLTDASFLIEVSFRGPSNVIFNVTNARPQSLPDTSLASKVFKVPLESHV
ncbi:uncharacterized protein LOC108624059 isoform X2 [Ceratina calcarata]|uniref:Uncharacterized protein LOC108624059 isoform X2 n=1 Tax=Ceratina calcarata TaxID=156304 RepID=A0AAJ7WA20_9HYME|nr:uncharacterized protein LOC108624059 isoform X2 [Ceratina calcarata]